MQEDKGDYEGVLLSEFHLDDVGTLRLGIFGVGQGSFNVLLDSMGFRRFIPSFMNVLDAGVHVVSLPDNLGVDEVKKILGGVNLKWHLVAKSTKVLSSCHGRAEIAGFPL